MARSNFTNIEVGDKIVIIEDTKFGMKIKYFGILMGIGVGRAVRNNSTSNRCMDGFVNEWSGLTENNRYCMVAVPVYIKEKGVIEWKPYSTQKSDVMLDRQSVREIDEITRTKIKDNDWLRRMANIAQDLEDKVAHEIVSHVFGSTYVETKRLAKVLVEAGVHPKVDMDARLNEETAKALKEFNRAQLDAMPTDF